jgi:hypothetical protein
MRYIQGSFLTLAILNPPFPPLSVRVVLMLCQHHEVGEGAGRPRVEKILVGLQDVQLPLTLKFISGSIKAISKK